MLDGVLGFEIKSTMNDDRGLNGVPAVNRWIIQGGTVDPVGRMRERGIVGEGGDSVLERWVEDGAGLNSEGHLEMSLGPP